jgi:transposase
MDNARFHQSLKTKELIEGAGCKMLFLPAYSPDFNPIEEWWAILKAKIRKTLPNLDTLEQAIIDAILSCQYHKLNSKIL